MKSLMEALKNRIFPLKEFTSKDYWIDRYDSGGNSGPGSYGHLARFKANVLNDFSIENNIASVIEFGCGDGNQLLSASYRSYTGYDISKAAVSACRTIFQHDKTKEFFPTEDYDGRKAELTMSLDVIFHLTEDEVFDTYMRRLFEASSRYVGIYSSDQDTPIKPISPHVRHRRFSTWIDNHIIKSGDWRLFKKVSNPFPYNGDSNTTSFSDFSFYKKE